MSSVVETILEKDPASMFACFDQLPQAVFDKRKLKETTPKPSNPRRLLLQQFHAVADKKIGSTRSSVFELSRKFYEASDRSIQNSMSRQSLSGTRDQKTVKTVNLYRVSVGTKRFSKKEPMKGMNNSMRSIAAPLIRHKQPSISRIV